MKRLIKYTFYGLIFLSALAVGAYVTTRTIIKSGPEVLVPDLTGQDTVTALDVLTGVGLNLKVQDFSYSEKVPKDHILGQEPAPGTRIKKDRDVRIIISRGRKAIPLPNLTGISLEQARSILNQNDLSPGIVSYTYGVGPDQGRGKVLAQIPEPGTPVAQGTWVDLLLSLGPRPVEWVMPDLTAQTYSLALLSLERVGLKLGPLEYESRPNWPAGAVLIQYPPPGSRVPYGALVKLTVNREVGTEVADYRFYLLDYRIPYGLLKREIRFQIAVGGFLFDVHDEWHMAGERVQVLALVPGPFRAYVYEDDEKHVLIEKQIRETLYD